MRLSWGRCLSASAAALLVLFASEPARAQAWSQVWSDEFNGTSLDTGNWSYETGGGGWGNNELQNYTNRTQNVRVEGGNLVIEARQESFGGNAYTSGRIRSIHKRFWKYGKLEARIRVPSATGVWPAFWMLGENFDSIGWPRCGEIDIMEHIGGGTNFGAMHWDLNGHQYWTGQIGCPGACGDAYHTYGIEWTPQEIRWYFDGIQFHAGNITINNTEEFHQPFHILLNVAVGGNWPGPPNGTAFPQRMLVDWVRVYQQGVGPTPTPRPSSPYLGSPVNLPGTVQAENFDRGGQGVGFSDTTPSNLGGYAYRTDQAESGSVDIASNCATCVNYVAPGEWLRYAVNVPAAGTYTFNLRHAGTGGGVFHVETTTGVNLTGAMTQPNTGSWDTYQTLTRSVSLPAGSYGLRLVADSCPANCNLNNVDWLSFTGGPAVTPSPTPRPGATFTPTPTPRPGATSTPTPTSPPGGTTWAPNTAYAVGAIVTYQGATYRCLQAHTSIVTWEPPNVPALWQLQSGTPPPTPRPGTPTPTPRPGGPTATPTPTPTASAPGGWRLVWSDEFSGSGAPSSANWNYHVGNGFNAGAFAGWGNGEWEWYRPENCSQSGGNLVIRADYNTSPTNIAGRDWYQRSCRITTQGKHSWRYGKIEVRASVPNAAGAWPAFWMMGTSSGGSNTGNYNAPISYFDTMATNWASCGEIDLIEKRNYEGININNIFWDLRTGVFPWTAGQNANYESRTTVGDMSQFHVYSIEWDAQFIRWFVDGRQTHIIDITPGTLEEFHKPFYLIMNLALAGAFPQMEPNRAEFPLFMRVDYVRVYQK